VRVERVTPGRRAPARLAGSVLTRDLTVDGKRWSKGRRLSAEDLLALAAEEPGPAVTVLVASGNELHEDEAALRLAKAIAGPGLDARGPNQSRLDLIASVDGVVHVRIVELERINRLDPLEVFTVFDGQVVEKGDLVASVKIAPHLVDAGVIDAGARIAGFGSQPIVEIAPFTPRRVGVVVKESVRAISS
jgi:molybdenum cofactor cytidylyltransferase